MDRSLELRLYLDDSAKSGELASYVDELARLTDKLQVVRVPAEEAAAEGERPCVRVFCGGEPAGIAAIFATETECAGYPVRSIFDPNDLPDYRSYDAHNCPWCKEGKKIDALVNSFGYSSI